MTAYLVLAAFGAAMVFYVRRTGERARAAEEELEELKVRVYGARGEFWQ